jgi:hypothetical protein
MLFFKYSEYLGVSPAEMEFADQQATEQQQQMQQMGGIPMPQPTDQSQTQPQEAPVQQL